MSLLSPRLQLKVSQKQILTPGLVQMVTVLQLNRLELKEMITQEIVKNPVLEEATEEPGEEITPEELTPLLEAEQEHVTDPADRQILEMAVLSEANTPDGTAGDLATPAAEAYNAEVGKVFKTIPPFGAAAPQASSTFTYGYYINTWGLLEGLKAVGGDISGGQKALQTALAKVKLNSPYGPVSLDANRQAILNVFYQQLYLKNGKLAIRTVGEVPSVNQTFGGTFSSSTPAPGRSFPTCTKRSLPWVGKEVHPKVSD